MEEVRSSSPPVVTKICEPNTYISSMAPSNTRKMKFSIENFFSRRLGTILNFVFHCKKTNGRLGKRIEIEEFLLFLKANIHKYTNTQTVIK